MTGRLIVSVAGLLAGLILVEWVDAEDAQRSLLRPGTLVDRIERFRKSLLNERGASADRRATDQSQTRSGSAVGAAAPTTEVQRGGGRGHSSNAVPADLSAGVTDAGSNAHRSASTAAGEKPRPRHDVALRAKQFQPAQRARPRAATKNTGAYQQPLSGPKRKPAASVPKPAQIVQEPTPATRVPSQAQRKPTLARRRPAPTRQEPTPARPDTEAHRGGDQPHVPTPRVARALDSAPPSAGVPLGVSPEGAAIDTWHSTGAETLPPRVTPSTDAPPMPAKRSILSSQHAAHLTARVEGPRTIMVGRSADFRVTVANQGEIQANDVTVQIKIPSWAQLAGNTPTIGTTQLDTRRANVAILVWAFGGLGVGQEQHVDLQIVPQRGQALELGVSCTCAQPVAQAVVEVQEPKLELVLAGPDEALYGETRHFALTLTNPGTGPAENVVVHVLHLGGGDKVENLHKLGTLAPGMNRKIDMEMIARQTGTVLVKAQATALGGLRTEATKEIFVRRPALRIEVAGPQAQFAGTLATYRIRVANPGTATARSVTVSAALPRDATHVESSGGGLFGAEQGKVTWQMGALEANADRLLDLTCVLKSPGKNRVEVFAQASTDLTDSCVKSTDVIAVADLTLDLQDPTGPVLVGQETAYEIRVHNRGTKRADDIDVVTFFSEGIEPLDADGAPYDVGPGQVVFHTIEGLEAGEDLVLVIKAEANRPGNLVCRTEVLCRSADIRLAAEETTRFYGQGLARPSRQEAAEAVAPAGRSAARSPRPSTRPRRAR